MITLAINPNFGKELFTDIIPILFYIVLGIMIISLITSAYKKNTKEFLTVFLMFAIVLVICKKPDLLLVLGDFLVINTGEILKNLIV
jgi:uncharacterized membrane protein SirB2